MAVLSGAAATWRHLAPWLMMTLLLLGAEPSLGSDAIVVIANAELVELQELSLPLLRQLYLGRRTRYGDQRIHFFELAPGTELRRAFARIVLGLSERELDQYWLEQALSGGPLPPREIATPEELVRHVSSRRGAIAYLDWDVFRGLPTAGARAIPLRSGERLLLPDDPAYPIRRLGGREPGAGN